MKPSRSPETTTASRTVGLNVRRMRRLRRWSMQALVARTEAAGHRLSYGAIQTLETGRHPNRARSLRAVTVDELLVLARVFDVPPTLLLTHTPDTDTDAAPQH